MGNPKGSVEVTIDSHHVGMIGEGRFIAYASSRGWDIYRSLDGHTPCDYVVLMPEGLRRVEVKRIESVQENFDNYYYCTVTKLDTSKFDYIFVSTPSGDYFIPESDCPRKMLSIKQPRLPGKYQRNITKPGKYEVYRVEQ